MGLYEYGVLWRLSKLLSVIRERIGRLVRLESLAFLRFMWRNNTANNTEPKTRLNRARIAPKLRTTQKQPHVELSEVHFHIHNLILAFWYESEFPIQSL